MTIFAEIYNTGYEEGLKKASRSVPNDVRECVLWLLSNTVSHQAWDRFPEWMDDAWADEAATLQIAEYLGVL